MKSSNNCFLTYFISDTHELQRKPNLSVYQFNPELRRRTSKSNFGSEQEIQFCDALVSGINNAEPHIRFVRMRPLMW